MSVFKMSKVFEGIWIGPYPEPYEALTLKENNVKSILSVNHIQVSALAFQEFNVKHLHLLDDPSQDILHCLEDGIAYIHNSSKIGDVYVHCTAGISRSGSFVTAYLMRYHDYSLPDALAKIRQFRYIMPNMGFMNQLKLFEVMGCKVDKEHPSYLIYTSRNLANDAGTSRLTFKQRYADIDIFDSNWTKPASYHCTKCRTQVFSFKDLLPHKDPSTDKVCAKGELFTAPLDWLKGTSSEVYGKIYCRSCKLKLGSFNWCGEKCPCGAWVVPAFHFNRNHFDKREEQDNVARHLAIADP